MILMDNLYLICWKFKAKIDTYFLFQNIYFYHGFFFVKMYLYLMYKSLKMAHM